MEENLTAHLAADNRKHFNIVSDSLVDMEAKLSAIRRLLRQGGGGGGDGEQGRKLLSCCQSQELSQYGNLTPECPD